MDPAQPTIAGSAPAHLDAACMRLNEWRGRLVENFARSEQAVTETLALMEVAPSGGRNPRLPHLVGQRYDRLGTLLADDAGPSGHAKVASAALRGFREHDALRAMLCHGVARIAVDRVGDWVAVLTLTSFRSGAVATDRLTVMESEGRALIERVVDDRRRVCAALGQVRREAQRVTRTTRSPSVAPR